MRGRVTIESREKFNTWLAQRAIEQNQAGYTPEPAESE
jgi:heme/copper-type cytochrome/quinol oxidase subunit 2